MSVFTVYMTPGPSIVRTAAMSFVAMDMISPVRCAGTTAAGSVCEVLEQLVAQVVLELRARCAMISCRIAYLNSPAHDGDREDDEGVAPELGRR